jgi:hypothetical protein
VGVIKEGQAMRYLNGQRLWDKKYHRAAKQVEKQRRKNLKMAKERDSKKLIRFWEDRLKRRERERDHEQVSSDTEEVSVSGWETDGPSRRNSNSIDRGNGNGNDHLIDQSWSWEWALHGEAPPPSAIVSRRDFVSRHIPSIGVKREYPNVSPKPVI